MIPQVITRTNRITRNIILSRISVFFCISNIKSFRLWPMSSIWSLSYSPSWPYSAHSGSLRTRTLDTASGKSVRSLTAPKRRSTTMIRLITSTWSALSLTKVNRKTTTALTLAEWKICCLREWYDDAVRIVYCTKIIYEIEEYLKPHVHVFLTTKICLLYHTTIMILLVYFLWWLIFSLGLSFICFV